MNASIHEQIGSLVPQHAAAVSVIIPNYNTAQYIAETLDSVFAQTFTDYEIIVINDGSPDTAELRTVLGTYLDRITFIDIAENNGTSATRNFAAERARGGIFAFLDSDDIWHPTFLAELLDFKRAGNYDMVYADARTFGDGHAKIPDFLGVNPCEGEITRDLLVGGKCHILPSGTLVGAAAFHRCRGFDPGVKTTEDFDLWMRLIFAGSRIGYLKKILFNYRLRLGSGSGDSVQRVRRCRDVWLILQDKLPFTDEENAVVERHIANEEAAIVRAEGRVAIANRDWPVARQKFRNALAWANKLHLPLAHRTRMLLIWLLLGVSPGMVFKLLVRNRSGEIAHMAEYSPMPAPAADFPGNVSKKAPIFQPPFVATHGKFD